MADLDKIKRTPESTLDLALIELCRSVKAKRARTVIDHILENGIITNEELSDMYGYDHPPRAIRDVRENGIPLITHNVTSPLPLHSPPVNPYITSAGLPAMAINV